MFKRVGRGSWAGVGAKGSWTVGCVGLGLDQHT